MSRRTRRMVKHSKQLHQKEAPTNTKGHTGRVQPSPTKAVMLADEQNRRNHCKPAKRAA